MSSRRSVSPVPSSAGGSSYYLHSQASNSTTTQPMSSRLIEPDAPPRRKKRGRSLSTTRLSSLDGDATPYGMMAPMNRSFGYDRGIGVWLPFIPCIHQYLFYFQRRPHLVTTRAGLSPSSSATCPPTSLIPCQILQRMCVRHPSWRKVPRVNHLRRHRRLLNQTRQSPQHCRCKLK